MKKAKPKPISFKTQMAQGNDPLLKYIHKEKEEKEKGETKRAKTNA